LGLQLLEDLDATAMKNQGIPPGPPLDDFAPPSCERGSELNEFPRIAATDGESSEMENLSALKAEFIQHAHAAHRQFAKTAAEATQAKNAHPAPSQTIETDSPAVLEKLELLDDLVYESLSGNTQAMIQLQTAWPRLQMDLEERLLAESREQYLRYALSIWEENIEKDGHRDPAHAVQALDVLCLLFQGE
jgi:hypothetical protein